MCKKMSKSHTYQITLEESVRLQLMRAGGIRLLKWSQVDGQATAFQQGAQQCGL